MADGSAVLAEQREVYALLATSSYRYTWKPRDDDRWLISGIVHVPISGGGWKDTTPVYGPRKTLYTVLGSLARPLRLGEYVP